MSLLVWEKPSHTEWTTTVVGKCDNIQLTAIEYRRKNGSPPIIQIDWSERADGRSYPSFHTSKQAASEFIRDELNAILSKRGKMIGQ